MQKKLKRITIVHNKLDAWRWSDDTIYLSPDESKTIGDLKIHSVLMHEGMSTLGHLVEVDGMTIVYLGFLSKKIDNFKKEIDKLADGKKIDIVIMFYDPKGKTDEWVEFKGTAQSDSVILLHEIKVIYGEVEDDDWEINGVIDSVGTEEKRIYMLSLPIKFDKDTEYNQAFESFSDIRSGIFVEIEGSFLQTAFLDCNRGN